MKKKYFLSILLALALVLSLMPGMRLTALAADSKACAAREVTTDTNKTQSGDDLTALQMAFNGEPWSFTRLAGGETLPPPVKLGISKRNLTRGELPGAFLQIKEGDTVVESWTSDGTIHQVAASLTAGMAYTLHEETAPEGYLKAADISFSVDINGKVVTTAEVETDTDSEGEVIVMYDSSEASQNTSLTVTKSLVFKNKSIDIEMDVSVRSGTFYVALYQDASLTKMIGEPQAITFDNEHSSSTTFTGIEPEFTYYIAEVDFTADGRWTPRSANVESTEDYAPQYGVYDAEMEMFRSNEEDYDEVSAEEGENAAVFENVYVVWPDNDGPEPVVTAAPESLDAVTVDDIADQIYTGSATTPMVTVKDGDQALSPGTDYTVSYSNNINAADKSAAKAPTVTITGRGNYTGTKTVSFTIKQKDLTIKAADQSVEVGCSIAASVDQTAITGGALVSGHTLSTVHLNLATDTATENAGEYEDAIVVGGAVIRDASDHDVTANYNITYVSGRLTVTKVKAKVTYLPEAKAGLFYTGASQELITEGTADTHMEYALGTETEATEAYTTSIPAKAAAGTYYIWYKAAGDDTHADSEPAFVEATIEAAAILKLQVTKQLSDWYDETSFAFALTSIDGAPMPENGGETATAVRENPTAEFGEILYREPGVYKYMITETDGGVPGILYDANPHNVDVTVLEDDEAPGKLTAIASYDDGKDSLTITNDYLAKPLFESNVQDNNDTTGELSPWQDTADFDIGDPVPFRLTATLPEDVLAYKKYHITFEDQMEEGFTFQRDSVRVTFNDQEIPENEYELKVAGEQSFSLTLRWDRVDDDFNGAVVRADFTAVLNENAVPGRQGNLNGARLLYSYNPASDSDGAEDERITDWDYNSVFTYKLVVNKVDADENALEGAAFRLEKKMADGTTKEYRLSQDGNKFTSEGLDDGDYLLTETCIPDGYKAIEPITFVIWADHCMSWDAASEQFNVEIENRKDVLMSLRGEGDNNLVFEANEDLSALSVNVANTYIEPAVVTKAPAAKALRYTGSAQELVTAGEADGGEIRYALGEDAANAPISGWDTAIPSKTDAGTYYVWYFVKGDENHTDTEPECLTVNIAGNYFKYYSLTLNGDIGLNFYLDLTGEEAEKAAVYFTWMKNGTERTASVKMKATDPDAPGYRASCYVSASEMRTKITATLVFNTEEGGQIMETAEYSVAQYVDVILTSDDFANKFVEEHGNDGPQRLEKLRTLVRKMLAYGDHARAYFDTSAAPVVPAPEEEIPESGCTVTELPAGVTFEGATLSLKSQTTLSLYFNSETDLQLTCDGQTAETSHDGTEYVIRIRNIPAAKLDQSFTVTVNGTGTVTYSPLTYCWKAQQASADQKLVNTVKALYSYWDAAEKYFV